MTTIEYAQLYIDGQWAAPASAERIRVTEAATEKPLGSVPAAAERDIDAAVGAARKAFDDPEGWPPGHRRGEGTCSNGSRSRWRHGARRLHAGFRSRTACRCGWRRISRRASRRCCCVTTPA